MTLQSKRLPTLDELETQLKENQISNLHYWKIKSILLPDDFDTQIEAARVIMAK